MSATRTSITPYVLPAARVPRTRAWRQRFDLLKAVVGAQLRTEFDRHLLGWVWWVLEPVMLALTFFLIVTFFVRIGTGSRFWLILASVFTWRWFSRSVDHAAVMSRQFAPYLELGSVSLQQLFITFLATEVVVFAIALSALCIPMALFQHLLTPNFIPGLLILVVVQGLVTYTMAAVAYIIGTYSHDGAKVTAFIVGLWFYISPGIYLRQDALHRAPGWVVHLLQLNPFWTIMGGWQDILVRGQTPPYKWLAVWLAVAAVLCVLAAAVMLRLRRPLVHRAIEAAR